MQKNTVKIILVAEPSASIRQRIESFVAKQHSSSQVEFVYEIDGSILGGILIIDGDKYYDGTLKRQLVDIRKALS